VGGELSVPYTCPSRLATRHAAHVTPCSPCPVGGDDAYATNYTAARRTESNDVYIATRTAYGFTTYTPPGHTRPHTRSHKHSRTDERTRDTTAETTVRIPTDMSRRLSRWQLGARAGRRAAGLWESPLRWPATGSDVRRSKGAFVPGPFMHAKYRYAHAPYTCAVAGPFRFHPIGKESLVFRFSPNNNIMIF